MLEFPLWCNEIGGLSAGMQVWGPVWSVGWGAGIPTAIAQIWSLAWELHMLLSGKKKKKKKKITVSSCLILMKLIPIRNECPLGLFSQKKHQEPQGSRTECSMQTFKLRFNGTNILLVLTLLVLGLQSCISSEWSYEDSLNRVLNPFSFPAASYLGELFCRPWELFRNT